MNKFAAGCTHGATVGARVYVTNMHVASVPVSV